MAQAAVVILSGTDGHENTARIVNALETAKEFAETDGDDLELIFDGAGTQWIPELEDPESDQHELYAAIKDDAVACDFCTSAFDVDVDVSLDAGVSRLDDHDGHPSIRSRVDDGYEVLTF